MQKKDSKKNSLLEIILAIIVILIPLLPMNDSYLEPLFILLGLLLCGLFILLGFLYRRYGLIICACIGFIIAIIKIYGGYNNFTYFIKLIVSDFIK